MRPPPGKGGGESSWTLTLGGGGSAADCVLLVWRTGPRLAKSQTCCSLDAYCFSRFSSRRAKEGRVDDIFKNVQGRRRCQRECDLQSTPVFACLGLHCKDGADIVSTNGPKKLHNDWP